MSFDPGDLNAIHARLVEGDPTASSDLIGLLYGPLIGHAIKKHGWVGLSQDLAKDFAVKVLAEVIEQPESFDPSKGNLFGFLCMALDADVQNAARDAKTRRRIFSDYAVEVREVTGTLYVTSPETSIDAKRIAERYRSEIVLEAGDDEVLSLMLDGERDYDRYAGALGIENLPLGERREVVKRRKDRIEKRIERIRKKL
jgi:hypothetical protein